MLHGAKSSLNRLLEFLSQTEQALGKGHGPKAIREYARTAPNIPVFGHPLWPPKAGVGGEKDEEEMEEEEEV